MTRRRKNILKGEVYLCNLGSPEGNVQGGNRPVIVVQNNRGNEYSETVIVIPVTSKPKPAIVTHFTINYGESSTAMAEQITTIPKSSLEGKRLYYLSGREMAIMDHALMSSLGIT